MSLKKWLMKDTGKSFIKNKIGGGVMKNICFVNSYTFWGGGEKSYFKYGKELQKMENKVYFLVKKESELGKRVKEDGWAEVEYIRTGGSCQYNPFLFFKVLWFLIKNDIDVIFLNSHRDWKAVGIPAWIKGIKKVIYTKGTSDGIGNSLTTKFYFDNIITDVVVKSDDSAIKLLENSGRLMKGKIRVVKNGIEFENFNSRREKQSRKTVILGVSARLEKVKRVSDLIAITDILVNKDKVDVKLLICGEGEERVALEKEAKERGVDSAVSFEGFKKDIVPFLNSIDIFLFASEMEGLSNSIMEAMALGKPVVCYNISSMPELVRDNENGFLIPPFNLEKFAEKVKELIENKDLREKMGEIGVKFVKEEFSMENTMKNYERVINS